MMRTSKISLGTSDYRLWILALAILSVVLLMAVRRSWFQDELFSAPIREDFHLPLSLPSKGYGYPPILAYWICGTSGDSKRMLRLLKAIYHPRNQYLLQLDADSSDYERVDLVVSIQSQNLFRSFGNVNVVGKSYGVNRIGSSALAATLHAAALLLKLNQDWDWFINLSPADYPIMSQDDILHVFTSLPRKLNFIHFSNESEWKEKRRIEQIVIDPSLYLQKSSDLFYTVETRTPDAFKIFGGSPWLILTRDLMEYCVKGWDNLPRKLIMYFSNVAYPIEFYFHTVICNSPEFQNTTVNTELRYNILEDPNFNKILDGGAAAAFARPFKEGDSELNRIDKMILNRLPDGVVPGNWCLSQGMNVNYRESKNWKLCLTWSNIDYVKPGPFALKLALSFSELQIDGKIRTNHHCHQ
ncbi:hypothetical protein P3X46_020122 [Hevea brasiliensis]|uniref:Uncharacterized protein n=1 Tax=Hevea brasiliensis TaxID=3981 RepID=A0ABQ9LKY9_HEVBR|nr:beta-glucuronosyltransferase GlcAT14A [Hevea brasiliensis]KAJ9168622.1 hypothetical protein P3X46_020122 [Hevea brasiliensis]